MYSYTSSNAPCAACKNLRRKCTDDCVFAPYFRADQPQKFTSVHKVFGASNVTKLLNELPVEQREDAVNSLVYEADARLRDPVYGCAGLISILQHKLKNLRIDLYNAKKELASYIGPSAMLPILQGTENFLPQYQQEQAQAQAQMMSYNMQQAQMISPYNMQRPQKLAPYSMQRGQMRPHNMQQAHMRHSNVQQAQMMGGLQQTVTNPSSLAIQQQQQYQQFMEAQQVAAAVAAVKEQELLRSYEAQQAFAAKEQELLRNNDLQELEILRKQEYYKNFMAQHIAKREEEVILRTYREKQQVTLAQQQGPQSDLLVGYDITGQGQAAIAKKQELLRNNELEQEYHKSYRAQQIAARENELIFGTYSEKEQASRAQQQGPRSDLLVGYDITGQGQGQGQAATAKEQELLRNNELEEVEILKEQEYYKSYRAQQIAARENELIFRTYCEKEQATLAQQQGPQSDLLVGYDITGQGQAATAKEQELLRYNELEEVEILGEQEYYKSYRAQQIAARENELIFRTYGEKQQAALAQQQGPQSDLLVGYDITGQCQAATAKEQELLRYNELEEVEILGEQEYYKSYRAQQIAARENELIFRTYCEKQQAALAQQQGPQSDFLVGYDITGQGQGQGQIPSGELSHMSVQAGMTPALAFGSLESPYQIQQHTQDDQPHHHHHHHHLQATQLSLEEEEELQALALALEQPLKLDPHEALALEQPLQLDPQKEEQQHQDGSEEEVGSFDPGSIGPLC